MPLRGWSARAPIPERLQFRKRSASRSQGRIRQHDSMNWSLALRLNFTFWGEIQDGARAFRYRFLSL